MKSFKAWRSKSYCGFFIRDCGDPKVPGSKSGFRWRPIPSLGILTLLMLFLISITMKEQYEQTRVDVRRQPFDSGKIPNFSGSSHRKHLSEELEDEWQNHERHRHHRGYRREGVESLPRGIVQETSDLELKPLWSKRKDIRKQQKSLLAMTVGIKQKTNVNRIVQKFLSENFTIILFHYDGNLDGWNDLQWSNKAIHVVAQNQTKWWFAKRFLHPAIVSIYDYIFIWDEDLGVENFHPGRYLKIMKAEGLEISQPALDPNSTEIHHKLTIRNRTRRVHRRTNNSRWSSNCSAISIEPPCAGWVEGMVPVFTRSAWQCTWHLIQNDLIHGWGMDMKLGYCAKGDRTKNIGVIDSEYVFHQGIQTLGGPSANKSSVAVAPAQRSGTKATSDTRHDPRYHDPRSEIRRQSSAELEIFRRRWERAVQEDKSWVDPFERLKKQRRHLYRKPMLGQKLP
uniref:Lysine ketoglutarate reductase trans-splicing-like protein n=1 Tax=Araucaria cunninghamii TaxID=56994 RepID=A0A0D6R0X9_ARACU